MELFTRVTIPRSSIRFDYSDRIILLGSCFAENIGKKLEENKFGVDINPFGILYNPASVAQAIRTLIRPEQYTPDDLFEHEGVYRSFAHHSRFSSLSAGQTLENMNNRLMSAAELLQDATQIVVTFGTACVYRLKSSGQVVANCHKLPEKMFTRQMLGAEEIEKEWKALLLSLWEHNPKAKILFTVSPVRHWKDGAHANQVSKATLLIAAERLRQAFPERINYFPAYEIQLDELRDYRFYAEDMLHPSQQAIDYIWQLFADNCLTEESRSLLKEWSGIVKAINHKPFQPQSKNYKQFIHQTMLKMEQIREKMPSFDMGMEMELLQSRVK